MVEQRICIDPPSNLGVIIAGLEVVESRFRVVVITTVAQGVYIRERSAAAYYIAPRVVAVACNNISAAVDDTDNVALCVEYVVVQRAVILHRQRLIAVIIDEVYGLAAARLTRHESAEGRELILRAVYGLAAANPRHVVGVAYVRIADRCSCQSAPLRPCERAAVVIPRRIAAAVVAYLMPVIRREQVAPRAVAVGVALCRAADLFALNVSCGVIGVGVACAADGRRGKLPLPVIAVGRYGHRRKQEHSKLCSAGGRFFRTTLPSMSISRCCQGQNQCTLLSSFSYQVGNLSFLYSAKPLNTCNTSL